MSNTPHDHTPSRIGDDGTVMRGIVELIRELIVQRFEDIMNMLKRIVLAFNMHFVGVTGDRMDGDHTGKFRIVQHHFEEFREITDLTIVRIVQQLQEHSCNGHAWETSSPPIVNGSRCRPICASSSVMPVAPPCSCKEYVRVTLLGTETR